MNEQLKARIRVKLESGKIVTHNWSFHSRPFLREWQRGMIGKKIHATDLTLAKIYGGYGKTAKILSVEEIRHRIVEKRKSNPFGIPSMDKLMRM